jgi:uncharacterized protein YdaT
MIKYTITRNMFEGDTFVTTVNFETQGEFDSWVVENAELLGEVYSADSVNVDDELAKAERLAEFNLKVKANKTKRVCDNIHAYISQLNLEKEYDVAMLDTIQTVSEVAAIFQALKDGRPDKCASLIASYSDETYYTNAEKQTIIDFITDSLT